MNYQSFLKNSTDCRSCLLFKEPDPTDSKGYVLSRTVVSVWKHAEQLRLIQTTIIEMNLKHLNSSRAIETKDLMVNLPS